MSFTALGAVGSILTDCAACLSTVQASAIPHELVLEGIAETAPSALFVVALLLVAKSALPQGFTFRTALQLALPAFVFIDEHVLVLVAEGTGASHQVVTLSCIALGTSIQVVALRTACQLAILALTFLEELIIS